MAELTTELNRLKREKNYPCMNLVTIPEVPELPEEKPKKKKSKTARERSKLCYRTRMNPLSKTLLTTMVALTILQPATAVTIGNPLIPTGLSQICCPSNGMQLVAYWLLFCLIMKAITVLREKDMGTSCKWAMTMSLLTLSTSLFTGSFTQGATPQVTHRHSAVAYAIMAQKPLTPEQAPVKFHDPGQPIIMTPGNITENYSGAPSSSPDARKTHPRSTKDLMKAYHGWLQALAGGMRETWRTFFVDSCLTRFDSVINPLSSKSQKVPNVIRALTQVTNDSSIIPQEGKPTLTIVPGRKAQTGMR